MLDTHHRDSGNDDKCRKSKRCGVLIPNARTRPPPKRNNRIPVRNGMRSAKAAPKSMRWSHHFDEAVVEPGDAVGAAGEFGIVGGDQKGTSFLADSGHQHAEHAGGGFLI